MRSAARLPHPTVAAKTKCLAQSNKSGTADSGRLTSADRENDEIRDGWKMTYITSEDLADLDDTIEDEMEVEEFARPLRVRRRRCCLICS